MHNYYIATHKFVLTSIDESIECDLLHRTIPWFIN